MNKYDCCVCRKLGKEEAAKALIANQEQTASERAAAAEEETAQHKLEICVGC